VVDSTFSARTIIRIAYPFRKEKIMIPTMSAIDRYVRSFQKSPAERAGAIHPSTLGKCVRQAIYQYQGVEPDREWTDRDLRVFAMGYRIEDFVADAYEYTGELIAHGIPLQGQWKGVDVVGEVDLILRVDGGWAIADVKSVHSKSFGYSSFPYGHHCYQVGAYEWLMSDLLTSSFDTIDFEVGDLCADLRSGKYGPQMDSRIIYVSKDDLRVEISRIGDEAKEMALQEIDQLVGYIKLDTIPDYRPFGSPEEHPWLCARRVRKGRRSKKTGLYPDDRKPLYKPRCRYFKQCWGVMPNEWNFWHEVIELPF
jgi:hypothetical protein